MTSEKKAGRSRMFDSFADRKLIVTRSLPSISNEIDKKTISRTLIRVSLDGKAHNKIFVEIFHHLFFRQFVLCTQKIVKFLDSKKIAIIFAVVFT